MELNKIEDKFPLLTPRDGQLEAVKFVLDKFESGKKFTIIEAPTGAGKSAIAVAVSQFFGRSYYLTIQKMLQDQLCADFGEHGRHGNFMIDLKGRNAYECPYKLNPQLHTKQSIDKWESTRPHTAADGHCKKKGKSNYKECLEAGLCPYFIQRENALASNMCLMNFASFLHQTSFTRQFTPRNLMIIDEGHNIETQLMNFVSLSLTDTSFSGITLPEYNDPDEYAAWIDGYHIRDILVSNLNRARAREDTKDMDEIEATIRKLDHFMEEMSQEDHDPWIVEFDKKKGSNRATFKPVFIKKYAHNMLFDYADHILIMSATILDVNVMARSLGINKKDISAKRVASRFPSEKHPIYFKPAVKVTGGKRAMDRWGGPLTKAVNDICAKYPEQRGIIHTHNFYIAEMLIERCKKSISKRLLFQKDFKNKTHMLEFHAAQNNTILIAPAMHEGIDLKDELSRFQIICKVPFPNHYEDKQLAARMEVDPTFYQWITALKLVQSVGRSVRSDEDWADTYIIDESFGWWYRSNKKLIPSWFKSSLILP